MEVEKHLKVHTEKRTISKEILKSKARYKFELPDIKTHCKVTVIKEV